MYRPPAFRIDDDTGLALAAEVAFGQLVVSGADGLDAVPVPYLIDRAAGQARLRCHVARANPIWHAAPCDALTIVAGPDAYVSPSWYPSKAEHGAVVPTWNYEVVHLHGSLVAHDDAAWLERLVRDLTDHHEAGRSDPWSVDDAPADFVARQLRAIVGLELAVTRVEGKRKLSQNRDEPDRAGALTGLRARADQGDPRSAAVADAMDRPLS